MITSGQLQFLYKIQQAGGKFCKTIKRACLFFIRGGGMASWPTLFASANFSLNQFRDID